jgi:DNA (cytosine-5)-methyltransferase 1
MISVNTSQEDQHDQSIRDTRPTVVDLFAGAGGTGLGFQQAGFRIVGAVEIDPNAAETYERNLGVKVKRVDIRQLSPVAFREELGLKEGELDVLVGCPPCQGFSRMRNKGGAQDARNDLVLRYLDYVAAFKPEFALFENVPGLIRTEHGRKFHEMLLNGLRELGYEPIEREEDVANYGVAQHRKRVVVLAGRDGPPKRFPEHTHGKPGELEVTAGLLQPWLTVQDAIGHYPALQAGENGEQGGRYSNHIAPSISQKVLNFIRRVPQNGGSRRDVPKKYWLRCHKSHNGHTDVYGRLSWKELANTITAGCTNLSKGRFVHPEQDRALTPREAAALQGFPDTFIFYCGDFSAQIGNAVPPPFAYSIAKTLRELLSLDTSRQNTCTDSSTDTLRTLAVSVGIQDA